MCQNTDLEAQKGKGTSRVQADRETVPQQLRGAPGQMEAGTEPERLWFGQATRQWLKHSQFLLKAFCRAGDGSSGQLVMLAWMTG